MSKDSTVVEAASSVREDGEELRRPPDRTPAELAAAAVEELRALARRTERADWTTRPDDLRDVVASLQQLAGHLPQALAQVATALDRLDTQELILTTDGTDPVTQAARVLAVLQRAQIQATTLRDVLGPAAAILATMAPAEDEFGVPAPPAAYGGAPDLLDEAELVTAEAGRLLAGDLSPAEERELLLRKAALADRTALAAADRGEAAELTERLAQGAARDAFALLQHDRRAGTSQGEPGADSPHWDASGGLAAYVRAQYLAWRIT
ncbi:hypothetical protein OG618_37615 (plasmid) [Kitasatospora sp. NBC_01246]|uniref:hypothetical protein n=1 Tax=Kitasatospora sp. NBC_01246 TaxID=2903570 RepID=UPI002E37C43B|nr:hypothetical protein [Kitasatospora sp. NBC_01246]